MFNFIRCYYLYLYYWSNRNRNTTGSISFIAGHFVFKIIVLMESPWGDGIYNLININDVRVDMGRITLSYAFVIIMSTSYILAYFMVKFRTTFDDVPDKLKQYNFFSGYSTIKFLAPGVVCGVIFYFLT